MGDSDSGAVLGPVRGFPGQAVTSSDASDEFSNTSVQPPGQPIAPAAAARDATISGTPALTGVDGNVTEMACSGRVRRVPVAADSIDGDAI
jgi:hypothetical protein